MLVVLNLFPTWTYIKGLLLASNTHSLPPDQGRAQIWDPSKGGHRYPVISHPAAPAQGAGFGSNKMDLSPQQCSGGGSATSVNIGRKIMWVSYLFMIGVSLQFLGQTADAAPVLASSLGFCQDIPIQAQPKILDCCLPAPKNGAKRFVLPKHAILRERKPAHVLAQDPNYVAKYNLAYSRMRALKKGDPLSYDTQWKTHCSFCNEAFLQRMLPGPNGLDVGIPLQVHYSWLFLPWHRMLIYFHEKILGKLINDPTFTLPFWNWDNQKDLGANTIPSLFLRDFKVGNRLVDNSALISVNRNTKHIPPMFLPLGYDSAMELQGIGQNKSNQEIIDENLSIIYTNVMTKVTSRDFLGGPYLLGTDNSGSSVPTGVTPGESGGSETLHNTAHEWVGLINDATHPDNEDMGNFIYAGKDPMFYTHHANVDRMWDVWKTLPDTVTPSGTRRREDFRDMDFLETEFTFYDEHGEMVIVKVRDTLDSAKLGYTYSKMTASDSLWINHTPKPAAAKTTAWEPREYPEVSPGANNTILDEPTCFMVSRRPPNATDLIGKPVKHVNQLAEEVVMEKIRVPHNRYVRFDAFIDLPSADRMTDFDQSDYVGSFTHLPSGLVNATNGLIRDLVKEEEFYRTVNVHFTISPSLARLGITDFHTPITLTIVPRMRYRKSTPVTFTNLRQDFQ